MQNAECRMQSAELWMIFARSENLQLFKFSCFYNVKLMRKTDEGGFQPQLCTLHSAFCILHSALCILHSHINPNLSKKPTAEAVGKDILNYYFKPYAAANSL